METLKDFATGKCQMKARITNSKRVAFKRNLLSILGQLYGMEKFWAFLKYYKHSSNLQVDPRLKRHLSKFNSVNDFRVDPVSGKIYLDEQVVSAKSFR